MKFRYKIYAKHDVYDGNEYYVKIQKHTGWPIFQWEIILDEVLPCVLYRINHNAFNRYSSVRNIPNKNIYDELKQYKSVEEIIMKYINQVILPNYKEEQNDSTCYELIGKFVLTNGWKTIDVKENDN